MRSEPFASPGADPVELVPYDDRWPRLFEQWRGRLADLLGGTAAGIEHIGSTAVPGLVAKPVIDIQVSVPDVADEPSYRTGLEQLGLALRAREPDHRFFRHDVAAGEPREVHVHVCSVGSRWEHAHLAFRDYLRRHPEQRDAYAARKIALAQRHREDRLAYTEAKTAFVAETLALAAAHEGPPNQASGHCGR